MQKTTYQGGQVQQYYCTEAQHLHCQSGEFWITINGLTEDFILRAGMGLRLYPGQICVIEACQPGTLLHQPSPQRAQRSPVFTRPATLFGPVVVRTLAHTLSRLIGKLHGRVSKLWAHS